MSLSKKNLDKLNNFKRNKNLKNNYNIGNSKKVNNKHLLDQNSSQAEDPNKIFYSLIDNSETLNETSEINHFLRNIEKRTTNKNSKNPDYSSNLTTEDELYDEFNYLLEE